MKSINADIIGGMFGLELSSLEKTTAHEHVPPFLAGPNLTLATARSAFTLLARSLQPKTVWLPSYLCGIVMGAFPTDLIDVRFFPIDEQLQISGSNWLSDVQPNDMVVFIDYFGFNTWLDWGQAVKQRGAWVVQDSSQALLCDYSASPAHYVIYSPRKFVGIPEGGVLLALDGAHLPDADLPSPPAAWWLEASRGSVLRAEFDRQGGENRWFEIFQKTELNGPLEPCRMSDLSLLILKHIVDWQMVSRQRRENYTFLASELGSIALFPELPENVVPLGFPVHLKNREAIRFALFADRIYPMVHWPIAGVVPPEFEASHRLAAEIMTIPCDQRYAQSDMQRIVEKVAPELRA